MDEESGEDFGDELDKVEGDEDDEDSEVETKVCASFSELKLCVSDSFAQKKAKAKPASSKSKKPQSKATKPMSSRSKKASKAVSDDED